MICAGVTGFVLFEDVLRNGARITTDHVLTLAVLMIVAAAGHKWSSEFRSKHVFSAAGLVVVFVAGAVYLVVASSGRNAEVMIAKRNAAHHANAERERIKPLLAEEEGRKRKTQDKLDADCVQGRKGKGHCDGIRTTLNVYTMAVKGYEAELRELGPEQEEDGALKSTARVIVAWNDTPEAGREEAEKRYVQRLELLLPYIKAVLVEIATVVFIGAGLGHRRATVAKSLQAATVASCEAPRERPSRPATVASVASLATVTQLRPAATVAHNCEALALQLLQRSATVAQEEVVQLFGGNKSRASRWLQRLEREGTVTRWIEGRQKFVELRHRASA
jgi:hypothetical protein